MNRTIKYVLMMDLAIIIFEIVNYGYGMINIAAGYNAKIMCSCVFVSGRTPQSVLDQDLAVSAAGFIGSIGDVILPWDKKKSDISERNRLYTCI